MTRYRAPLGWSLCANLAEDSLDAVGAILGGSGSASLGTRFVTKGYAFFTDPSAASLLAILGADDEEQIQTLSDVLRNSTEEEINDLMSKLTQAIGRLAEERDLDRRRRTRIGPHSSPSAQRRLARHGRDA